jgi:tetratricopeptide (TPR) repeat protein
MFRLFFCLLILASVVQADSVSDQILRIQNLKEGERKALASNYVTAGKDLYKRSKYEDAAAKFRKAIQLDPDSKEAERYLVLVQAALGSRRAAVSYEIDRLQDRSKVFEQERLVELNHLIYQAEHKYERAKIYKDDKEDLNKTVDMLDQSYTLYQRSDELAKTMTNTEQVSRARSKIKNRLKLLDQMMLESRGIIEAKNRKEIKEIMIKQMAENQDYLNSRTENMVDVGIENMKKEEYEKAIEIFDELLVIDPTNGKIKVLRNNAEKLRHKKRVKETQERKELEVSARLIEIKETFVPYASVVVYPDDWKEIKLREKKILVKQAEPEWKQKLRRQLETKISFEAPPLPLVDVISQIADQTGLNIVMDSKVTQEMDVDDLELQAIRFDDMKIKYILNWIVSEVKLSYTLHLDVVYITLPEGVKDEMHTEIIDVQDLLGRRQSFEGGALNAGAINTGDGADVDFEEDLDDEGEEGFNSELLLEMIQNSIPEGDWENEEAGIIIEFLESGALFIKNTAFVHNKLVDLLKQLRKTNSIQIEVQARLLTVEKEFFRDIGMDWKGLDRNRPLKTGEAHGFITSNDSGYNIAGSVINNLPSPLRDMGFFLEHSILSGFQAKVVFRALEQNRSVSTLTSPRLVLMNNASSYIQLIREKSFIRSYGTGGDDGNGAGAFTPNIESVDDAQSLTVRATVSSDRKYITLRARPTFNSVSLGRTASFNGTSTLGGLGAGLVTENFNYPIDLPVIEIKEIKTTAIIPDGGVLILGGVAESHEIDQEKGVPIISKIPVFGRLFRSNHNSDSSKDSMFLIHGKIIIFSEEEDSL